MADEDKGATGTQADPGTQPPAGTSGTQADPEKEEQPKEPESVSLDDARKLRSENKSLRDRLRALEEAEKARNEANLSETEKAKKSATELEAKLAAQERTGKERVLRYATDAEALRLGMKPDLVYKLLDQSAVEYDDEGRPSNLKEQITALAKTYPELVGSQGGTADGGVRGKPALTLEQIKKFSPEEHEKHRDEIFAVLAQRDQKR